MSGRPRSPPELRPSPATASSCPGELWGASLGHFASNYAFYLVLSWLPLYLVKAHGYSVAAMAQLGGAVYAGSALIGLICGGLADRWMAAGATATQVRRPMLAAGFVIGLLGMLACAQGDGRLAVAGLATYALRHGLVSFNTVGSGQTLAGPAAAAKWIGVQNFFANLAGIVAPIVTGALIDRSGDFRAAFLVAAAVLVLGLAGWTLLIRRVGPLGWTAAA